MDIDSGRIKTEAALELMRQGTQAQKAEAQRFVPIPSSLQQMLFRMNRAARRNWVRHHKQEWSDAVAADGGRSAEERAKDAQADPETVE